MMHYFKIVWFLSVTLSLIGFIGGGSLAVASTSISHATHFFSDKGPRLSHDESGCSVCHAEGQLQCQSRPLFADMNFLAVTEVCNPCHSPDGAYNGVNDAVIGAKNNWDAGIYESDGITLKAGKEKWCVGCHDGDAADVDNLPANSKADGSGAWAPRVAGDDASWGYYATGHGRNENNMVQCLDCHEATLTHIDHDQRTYSVLEFDTCGDCNNCGWIPEPGHEYCSSYRLADVTSDFNGDTFDPPEPAMIIPRKSWWECPLTLKQHHFRLCWKCHDKTKVLGDTKYTTPGPTIDCSGTNFWNQSFQRNEGPFNLHYEHLWRKSSYDCVNNQTGLHFWNSDWDIRWNCAQADSDASCPTCHNVHGSPTGPMIRHGELISPPGTKDLFPGFGFKYLKEGDGSSTATFTPTLAGGTYDVYAWWEQYSNRATNAKYIVNHDGGTDEVLVNQEQNGSQWNLLGQYSFAAGTGSVVLTSEGANEFIMADGVRWYRTDDDDEVIVDDADAGFQGSWTTGDGGYNNTQKWHYAPIETSSVEESFGGKMGMNGGNPWQNYMCKL